MTRTSPVITALAKAMKELGIPEHVETKEQTKERLGGIVKQLLAPYNKRPMILVRAEALADLQAINLMLLCFLFPDSTERKELWNFFHESLLTQLSDPELLQQVRDGHRAVDTAMGRRR